jgi:hypothetical protein
MSSKELLEIIMLIACTGSQTFESTSPGVKIGKMQNHTPKSLPWSVAYEI